MKPHATWLLKGLLGLCAKDTALYTLKRGAGKDMERSSRGGAMLQLYMWEYSKEGVQPMVVLKTRRSLRAVHFQPHGIPLLLTAEVKQSAEPPCTSLHFLALLLVPDCMPYSCTVLSHLACHPSYTGGVAHVS